MGKSHQIYLEVEKHLKNNILYDAVYMKLKNKTKLCIV